MYTRKVCHKKIYQESFGKDSRFSQSFAEKQKKKLTLARHYSAFHFIILFMYLFLVVLGHPCWAGFALVVASGGHSSRHCAGGLLLVVASLVVDHRL